MNGLQVLLIKELKDKGWQRCQSGLVSSLLSSPLYLSNFFICSRSNRRPNGAHQFDPIQPTIPFFLCLWCWNSVGLILFEAKFGKTMYDHMQLGVSIWQRSSAKFTASRLKTANHLACMPYIFCKIERKSKANYGFNLDMVWKKWVNDTEKTVSYICWQVHQISGSVQQWR